MTRAGKKFQRATQARQASALGGAAFAASQEAARGLSQLPGGPGSAPAQAVRFGSTVGCLCARLRSPPSPAARWRDRRAHLERRSTQGAHLSSSMVRFADFLLNGTVTQPLSAPISRRSAAEFFTNRLRWLHPPSNAATLPLLCAVHIRPCCFRGCRHCSA
jgi:hypothetical protein